MKIEKVVVSIGKWKCRASFDRIIILCQWTGLISSRQQATVQLSVKYAKINVHNTHTLFTNLFFFSRWLLFSFFCFERVCVCVCNNLDRFLFDENKIDIIRLVMVKWWTMWIMWRRCVCDWCVHFSDKWCGSIVNWCSMNGSYFVH